LDFLDVNDFDRLGQTCESIEKSGGLLVPSCLVADDDMEAAIEMSRQQMKQQETDTDLEEALRRSREEVNNDTAGIEHDVAAVDLAGNNDADLKRALELSMASTDGKKKQAETVDLTDLTDPRTSNFARKNKPASDSSPEIISLYDDSDEEEEEESKKRRVESPGQLKAKKAKTQSPPKEDDRDVKRQLAAEAALKRLQPH
jgi:hypothetical protein